MVSSLLKNDVKKKSPPALLLRSARLSADYLFLIMGGLVFAYNALEARRVRKALPGGQEIPKIEEGGDSPDK